MIRLKVFLILALLIFVSQAIKADEWNYGANGHATLVDHIYTYSNIENTSNGGTITSKFTGQLINGKRNGVWKATKIYWLKNTLHIKKEKKLSRNLRRILIVRPLKKRQIDWVAFTPL